ncbi:MAG: hypothetical protein RR324_09605 [Cellulosilyticaceae bacterium]
MNEDKEIRRTPMLDRYIQRVIAEQMNELEERKVVQAVRDLLNRDQSEPKNLN